MPPPDCDERGLFRHCILCGGKFYLNPVRDAVYGKGSWLQVLDCGGCRDGYQDPHTGKPYPRANLIAAGLERYEK